MLEELSAINQRDLIKSIQGINTKEVDYPFGNKSLSTTASSILNAKNIGM